MQPGSVVYLGAENGKKGKKKKRYGKKRKNWGEKERKKRDLVYFLDINICYLASFFVWAASFCGKLENMWRSDTSHCPMSVSARPYCQFLYLFLFFVSPFFFSMFLFSNVQQSMSAQRTKLSLWRTGRPLSYILAHFHRHWIKPIRSNYLLQIRDNTFGMTLS